MTKKRSPEESAQAATDTLTTARRLLTESRQYFLAVSAAIVAFGGIKVACAEMDLPPWLPWLALVPFPLVFFFETVPRLWRIHRERNLIRRSHRAEADPRPLIELLGGYFLIGPYPEERRRLFRRADGVHETVLRWIHRSRERVLVLTGSSGTGKSSLLQAFVIPELREGTAPCTVMLLRSFEDPLAELRRRLAEPGVIWTKPPADLHALGWKELLSRAVEQLRRKSSDASFVVVLDQFEEFVLVNPAGSGTPRWVAMREFLENLPRQAPDGFRLLLALRSDYKAFLEPLGVPPLRQGVNWQDVPAFRVSDAAEFLRAPETGFEMPAARLQRVLTEAAAVDGTRGLIRPIVLNMLGVVLRRIAGGPEAERPTRTLLADDLRRVVNDSCDRDLIRLILSHMLTDADTKRPRAIGELAQETGLDPQTIEGGLLDVALSGYVRPLSRPDEITARVWEISHDFVARLLGPILKTPLQTFWRRATAVLYPLSVVVWVLLLVGTIAGSPELEQVHAERALRDEFLLAIKMRGNSCAAERYLDPHGLGDRELARAIPYFSRIPPVNDLKLSQCTALTSVNALKELKSLQKLDLNGCAKLTNAQGLRELKSLQTLILNWCTALTSVNVRELGSLKTLELRGCTALTSVDGLQELKSLQMLDVRGCKTLTSVHFKDLKSLRDAQPKLVLRADDPELDRPEGAQEPADAQPELLPRVDERGRPPGI